MNKQKKLQENSSWDSVSKWYDSLVGKTGHYYHQEIIFPKLYTLLNLKNDPLSILDVGCGQGILPLNLPKSITYTGIDISRNLILQAKKYHRNRKNCSFVLHDATTPFETDKKYDHAIAILSLQNILHPDKAILNVSNLLKENGRFTIILNHPCFRIPRQSCWEEDQQNKILYRRINHYLSPLKIPITANPSKPNSPETITYHFPLSFWLNSLSDSNLMINKVEEWCSNKTSTGSKAKSENKAREQIPLFLAIQACKK